MKKKIKRILAAIFRLHTDEEILSLRNKILNATEEASLWRGALEATGSMIANIRYGWDNSQRKGPMAEREYFVFTMQELTKIKDHISHEKFTINRIATGRR